MLTEILTALWGFIFRKDKADDGINAATAANKSFERFIAKVEARLTITESRLDECDEDRNELRTEVGGLKVRVGECEEDRAELRDRVNTLEMQSKQS